MADKKITVKDARRELSKLTRRVLRRSERFVITNQGEPEAVLLGMTEYQSLKAAAELASIKSDALAFAETGFAEIANGQGLLLEEAFPEPKLVAAAMK